MTLVECCNNSGTEVDIQGIGELPSAFSVEFGGFNIDNSDTPGLLHNEANVETKCKEDTLFNDDFNVSGHATDTGYHVDIYINSEVKVMLWDKGDISLDYNSATRHWSMTGRSYANKEWLFCVPEGALRKVILPGLECAISSLDLPVEIRGALELIARSIKGDIDHPADGGVNILKSAHLYNKEDDCTKYLDPKVNTTPLVP